ncbi:MAG: class I SAM-dependent RNA methyltransferase [bacterium]|nr:class I SAM-dependent RNA methyltransferase [bacterium]
MNQIELTIDKAVYGGYGLARDNGKTVFVERAVPGDRVRVRFTQEKKDYSFAVIEELLTPSERRIEPECENFGSCGGCSYLNIDYEYELTLKKEILLDSLKRVGRMPEESIPQIETVFGDRFYYRSHGTVKSKDGVSGFYEKGSNNLIPFGPRGCLLLPDRLNQAIKSYHSTGKEFRAAQGHSEEVYCAEIGNGDSPKKGEKMPVIREKEQGVLYEREIDLFFQANRFLRSSMLNVVRDYAGLTPDDEFMDIGCGSGFFALYLSQYAKKGTGFDINKKSIAAARNNARLNKIENVKFHALSAPAIHPGRYNPGTIIADPPRAGISKKGRQTIIALEPEILVYVSCNPSTFARDAVTFNQAGYKLEKLTLLDMFPGTHHIELASRFVLSS